MKANRATSLLGLCIALALTANVAAQTKVKVRTPDPAMQAQLDAANADLERAAKRVADLHAKLGIEGGPNIRIIEKRGPQKPVIGVVLAPDAQSGVRVAAVTPDSGAAKAGLKAGDRITSVSGTPVLGNSGEIRVDNTRKLLGNLESGKPVRIDYVRAGKTASANVTPSPDADVVFIRTPGDGPMIRRIDVPGVGDGVREEVIRISPRRECKGKDCGMPMLAEAFRWNGLNLASVDANLGRYFGTSKGVLVLSTGPDLQGLQSGDVIQKIDGRVVNTPRDAMEALRAKDANAMALVEYMRDRKTASTRIKVPDVTFIPPPPPPAPPAPPRAPKAPPPPPAAFLNEDGKVEAIALHQVTWIGDDGQVQTITTQGDAN